MLAYWIEFCNHASIFDNYACMMKEKKIIDDKVKSKAKGGDARAKSLSPEKRKEIARNAANARHSPKLPTATHKGVLNVGDTLINCFVLSDGRRVISGRALTSAIGMKGRGQGIARIATLKALNSPENRELLMAIEEPIKFLGGSPRVGAPSDGFEATVLQTLCEAMLRSRDSGELKTEHELRYARHADMLIRSFARVGIIALVDEATGYQGVRPDDALQAYLEKVLNQELAAWAKKFPDEFYSNIYKLKGWAWPGMGKNRFSVVAHYTRDLIYERIGPGVLAELESRGPKDEKGNRKNKLHQWLSDDFGNPMLSQHIHSIMMLQRLSIANGQSWNRFLKSVDQVMPKRGSTLELELDGV